MKGKRVWIYAVENGYVGYFYEVDDVIGHQAIYTDAIDASIAACLFLEPLAAISKIDLLQAVAKAMEEE